jgi:dihydrofolate reductase
MLEIIVACAENEEGRWIIGNKGHIPWHIPGDLKLFRKKTLGHAVVMGRKTYESLPKRPLDNRHNIVLTNNNQYEAPGCEILASPDAVIQRYKDSLDKCFVIGGEQIYKLFIPHAHKLHVSRIDAIVSGDTFFPMERGIINEQFFPVSVERHDKDMISWREHIHERFGSRATSPVASQQS